MVWPVICAAGADTSVTAKIRTRSRSSSSDYRSLPSTSLRPHSLRCNIMSRVNFASELAAPPADRVRKDGVVYPRVAQIKGESSWKDYEDLYWGGKTLSSARVVEDDSDTQTVATPTPTSSIFLPMAELAIAASKVTSAIPRRALSYSANLVRGKLSEPNFVSYDGPTTTPPLSTPSSTTASTDSSENATPIEEYNRQLYLLPVARN
ncbi:hypothetical protein QCA50_002366 [Cerrena zonata]|uniref:Uncharacterized protein n=1 Tax=Cerrena zonata TaxID=2478898 RepID=A0AAW0GZ18_9APHY